MITSILRNAPALLTHFVGRDDDLAAITALLANPACRLLTIAGVGGEGKTRRRHLARVLFATSSRAALHG